MSRFRVPKRGQVQKSQMSRKEDIIKTQMSRKRDNLKVDFIGRWSAAGENFDMLSVLTQFFLIKISNFNMQTFNKSRCPETGQNLSSFVLFFENPICPLFGTSGHPKSHLSRSGQILSSKKTYGPAPGSRKSEPQRWEAARGL